MKEEIKKTLTEAYEIETLISSIDDLASRIDYKSESTEDAEHLIILLGIAERTAKKLKTDLEKIGLNSKME